MKRKRKNHVNAGKLQENPPELRVMVAGAGTGGHLFPGIAVIERLREMAGNVRPCFITTGRPIEKTVLEERNFETREISAAGMKGKSIWGKMASMGLLLRGVLEARRMLKTFKPHLVVGMGGYSSAPVVMAAWMAGVPRLIHEQNRVPGITNRLLARFSNRIFVSFTDTVIPGAKDRIQYSGYPVRSDIRRPPRRDGDLAEEGGSAAQKPMVILVLGGSQGARSINLAVTEALEHIENLFDFEFVHQTGTADEAYVKDRYEEKGVKALVSAFFNDMAAVYRKADLAVCRAGAGTLAELAVSGVPAILIPYPHAADDHQTANAEGYVAMGGAHIIWESEMTPESLAFLMMQYRSGKDVLQRMKTNLERHAAGDACGIIAREALRLAGFEKAYDG